MPPLGPDYMKLYLNGQIGPDHPNYEECHRMYGPSEQGQKLQRHTEENEFAKDGLENEGFNALQTVADGLKLEYNELELDRMELIHMIRKKRGTLPKVDKKAEKEKDENLTKEQEKIEAKQEEAQKSQDFMKKDNEERAERQAKKDKEREEKREEMKKKNEDSHEEHRKNGEQAAGLVEVGKQSALEKTAEKAAEREARDDKPKKEKEVKKEDTAEGPVSEDETGDDPVDHEKEKPAPKKRGRKKGSKNKSTQ